MFSELNFVRLLGRYVNCSLYLFDLNVNEICNRPENIVKLFHIKFRV